jgi:hypothetical protein
MYKVRLPHLAVVALVFGGACGGDDSGKGNGNGDDMDEAGDGDGDGNGDGAGDGDGTADDDTPDGTADGTADGADGTEDGTADGADDGVDDGVEDGDEVDPARQMAIDELVTTMCSKFVMCFPDDTTQEACETEYGEEFQSYFGNVSDSCFDAVNDFYACYADASCEDITSDDATPCDDTALVAACPELAEPDDGGTDGTDDGSDGQPGDGDGDGTDGDPDAGI